MLRRVSLCASASAVVGTLLVAALPILPSGASAPPAPSEPASANHPARRIVAPAGLLPLDEGPVTPVFRDVPIQPATLSDTEGRRTLDLATSLGVDVVNIGVSWSSYEPNQAVAPDVFSRLERFLGDLEARGVRARFQLSGFPTWARDPGRPTAADQPWLAPASAGELARWSAFVGRVVSRFGERVSYYEIWNEPNELKFWQAGPDPAAYARLLTTSYGVIKGLAPRSKVIFGGLSRNDVGFLEQTYAAVESSLPVPSHGHDFFDLLGVHPYSGDRGPTVMDPRRVYQDAFGLMDENFLGLMRMHATMAAHGDGDKHIYVGEYGFSTAGWHSFAPVDDTTRATYLMQAYQLAAQLGYIDALGWFSFLPMPWEEPGFAILDEAWTCHDTCAALGAVRFHR